MACPQRHHDRWRSRADGGKHPATIVRYVVRLYVKAGHAI